ncbi:MAG: DUF4397 domain-containing protein, partial [candidate division Zixibacteria bacterium]|nr:DUF4397 domain-containing protein [candidate division Zixibacteria bacterium]
MKSRKFLQIGTLLGVLALTAACSDDDNNTPLSPTSTPESNVMVIHASPNAPGVDIILNDAATPAVEDLVFPTNTGYVPLSSGTINVKVNAANSTTTVINENLTLA